jgi:hypothetical protein
MDFFPNLGAVPVPAGHLPTDREPTPEELLANSMRMKAQLMQLTADMHGSFVSKETGEPIAMPVTAEAAD